MDFDKYASNWDSDKRVNRAKLISEEMKKEINLKASKSAMEFGCGTGLISLNLHQELNEIDLIDTSKEMINKLNEKISDHQIKNMTGKCMDITKDEAVASSYDLIYSSMALHHIPDLKGILTKFYMNLQTGGQLCIVDLNTSKGFHDHEPDFDGHDGFDMEMLKDLAGQIGFKNITIRTFYQGVKESGNKKVNYELFILIGNK